MTGFQWVFSRGSDPGAGISYGSAYFGPVDDERKNVVDPTTLLAEGIKFYAEKGGHIPDEELSAFTISPVTTTGVTIGQHGTGFRWLVAEYDSEAADYLMDAFSDIPETEDEVLNDYEEVLPGVLEAVGSVLEAIGITEEDFGVYDSDRETTD